MSILFLQGFSPRSYPVHDPDEAEQNPEYDNRNRDNDDEHQQNLLGQNLFT